MLTAAAECGVSVVLA